MTEAAKSFCIDAITHNSNISAWKTVKLLSESELKIIVGKSIIARILNKLSYRYKIKLYLVLRNVINK